MTRWMRKVLCGSATVIVAVTGVSLISLAQSADMPPARHSSATTNASTAPSNLTGRDAAHPLRELFRAATTQERDEVIQFFQSHAPRRSSILMNNNDNWPVKAKIMQLATERYRRLQRTKDEDPDLYSLMVHQIELQDETSFLFRRAQRDGSSVDQNDLRSKVRELIDLNLQERSKRIEKLEAALADQKARLVEDQAHPDSLVDKQFARMKQEQGEFDAMRKNNVFDGGGPGGLRGNRLNRAIFPATNPTSP